MIIDVHSHCLQPDHVSEASRRADERAGYPPMQPLPFETYQEAMRLGDKSVVFGVRALACGALSPNDFTARWVAKDPDRIIGFMCIDPTEDGYLEEIERGVEPRAARDQDLSHAGALQSRRSVLLRPLREGPAAWSCRSCLNVGTHPNPRAILKYSHPLLFDEVAQAFPDLKIVIAHMGHPWQARLRGRHPQARQRLRRRLGRGLGAALLGLGGAGADGRMGVWPTSCSSARTSRSGRPRRAWGRCAA